MQHAKRMRRVILSSVACPALPYFSACLVNGTIFREKILNIKCVFLFSLHHLSETFLILRRIQRESVINLHWTSCTVHVTSFTL